MRNIKISVIAGLLLTTSAAFGGIAGSPHDLSTAYNGTDDNGEICVYCHTPHAGDALGAFAGAPLWNKGTQSGQTGFQMYGATAVNTTGLTIGNTVTPAAPSNPSLACLSCHDGVSSIDAIVNAPGSGLNSVNTDAAGTSMTERGTAGDLVNANAILSKNLTNTHPISIVYDVAADGTKKASLRATTDTLPVGTGGAWIGATLVSDLLRGDGRVECGSCHDPHNGGLVQNTATEVNFLRHTNERSELCLGCHNK